MHRYVWFVGLISLFVHGSLRAEEVVIPYDAMQKPQKNFYKHHYECQQFEKTHSKGQTVGQREGFDASYRHCMRQEDFPYPVLEGDAAHLEEEKLGNKNTKKSEESASQNDITPTENMPTVEVIEEEDGTIRKIYRYKKTR